MQTQSAIFGFSGPGAEDARDNYLHRGVRLASSVLGNVSRPEGFNTTGVAFAMAGGHGFVTSPSVSGGYGGGSRVAQLTRELASAIEEEARQGGRGSNPNGVLGHARGNIQGVINSYVDPSGIGRGYGNSSHQ